MGKQDHIPHWNGRMCSVCRSTPVLAFVYLVYSTVCLVLSPVNESIFERPDFASFIIITKYYQKTRQICQWGSPAYVLG